MRGLKSLSLLVTLTAPFLMMLSLAPAALADPSSISQVQCPKQIFPPGLYNNLTCDQITDPSGAQHIGGLHINGPGDIVTLIVNVVQLLLTFAGIIAVIIIIIGGITYITSSGNPQQVAKAKNIITNAIIGLVIVLSAYAIINFVTGAITG